MPHPSTEAMQKALSSCMGSIYKEARILAGQGGLKELVPPFSRDEEKEMK